jgi:SAM-dependent methyltransferase
MTSSPSPARHALRVLVRGYFALIDLMHAPLRRPRDSDPFHSVFTEFLALTAALDAPTVLELGSRNVSGVVRRSRFPNAGRYIGCDVHPGEGVDLVADAHRLSEVVPAESVDAVFSISVFEHLAFPWKVALEINRVLKPGGLVFVSTHPAWPPHELPWDFWRFPVAGLAHLFGPSAGFEVLRRVEGLPCKVYPLVEDASLREFHRHHVNAGVALIARKVAPYDPERLRWDVDLAAVEGEYPVRA